MKPLQKKQTMVTPTPRGWDATTYGNFKKANPNLEPDAIDTVRMRRAGTPQENKDYAAGQAMEAAHAKSQMAHPAMQKKMKDTFHQSSGHPAGQ